MASVVSGEVRLSYDPSTATFCLVQGWRQTFLLANLTFSQQEDLSTKLCIQAPLTHGRNLLPNVSLSFVNITKKQGYAHTQIPLF